MHKEREPLCYLKYKKKNQLEETISVLKKRLNNMRILKANQSIY